MAACAITTGGCNVALGTSAGATVTTGSNLTLLGHNAQASSATATNEITLGDANVTDLRVPGANFYISGQNVGVGVGAQTTSAEGTTIKGLTLGGNTANGVFTGLQLLNRVENTATTNAVTIDFDHKVSGATTIPLGRIASYPLSATAGSLRFYNSTGSALNEFMRADSPGRLRVNTGGESTGGIVNSSKASVSVSTTATNISGTNSYGSLAFVWGVSGGNIFHDLVSWSLSDVDVIASQNISATPAGRTYSASSGVLRVAMASGTYSVYESDIRTALS